MTQLTIYLQPEVLATVKSSASAAQLSVSQWISNLVVAQQGRARDDWAGFWERHDALADDPTDGAFDFLLDPATRYAGVKDDAPREPL
jgi:hypothetical protein